MNKNTVKDLLSIDAYKAKEPGRPLLSYNKDRMPGRYQTEPDSDWMSRLLSEKAVEEGLCFHSQHFGGKANYLELIDAVKDLGAAPIFTSPDLINKQPSMVLVSDDSFFNISTIDDEDGTCGIRIVTVNETKFMEFCNVLRPMFKKNKPSGKVYVLIPGPEGIQVESMGVAAAPLIADNYSPEVIEGFNRIVDDINNINPTGRLSILDGPAGSGKTHLLRSLMAACPKAMFILIPANMTSDLGGPSLISCLLNLKEPGRVIILAIEDADSCLTSRAADNMSAISSLLNISDGIIGNMIDIRIVCTTNADVKDIDEAILRPGRLSARVEVGLLDHAQAAQVYKRLTGGEEKAFKEGSFVSLAEVYAMTKKGLNNDFSAVGSIYSSKSKGALAKRQVGFSSNSRPTSPPKSGR